MTEKNKDFEIVAEALGFCNRCGSRNMDDYGCLDCFTEVFNRTTQDYLDKFESISDTEDTYK